MKPCSTTYVFVPFILLYFLFCTVVLSSDKNVYYTADVLSVQCDKTGQPEKLMLSGNVKVVFEEIVISCSNAVFNRAAGEITAENGIKVETPQGYFTSDYLTYNIYEEKGVLLNASFSSPPVYGKAEKIERDKKTFLLYKGYITTCDREDVHYRFSAEKIEYVYQDYIRAEKMKLVLGKNFNIFYFPRITLDEKTKTSPFLVSSGHTTRIGETLDMVFQQRVSQTTDTIMREKFSIGTESIGIGPEIESKDKNLKISTFIVRRLDEDEFAYGGWAEFHRVSPSDWGQDNLIIDWRWMYDDDFFYDFFNDLYLKKSKTYNHLSFSKNFKSGILNIDFRDNAQEDFLSIEKIPELRFYTPFIQLAEWPVFIENDFKITNFYKNEDYHLRSMDTLTINSRHNKGNILFAPYLSFSGIDYRNSDNKFNFSAEGGTSIATLMKKEHKNFTEYFRPSLSLFYRGLRYEKEELEYFDRTENVESGTFAGINMDWTFWKKDRYLGRLLVENLYDIDDNSLEELSLRYDIHLTQNIYVTGDNEWDASRRTYTFGVNDIIFNAEKYQCSLGTRYDEIGDICGITSGFQHNINNQWRYEIKLNYDFEEGSFNNYSIEIWKKAHCWEFNIKMTQDNDNFSFYIFTYPVFL